MENKKSYTWLIGPCVFAGSLAALLVTWALLPPAVLTHLFDQGGYSPFELATLPFFAAIAIVVWWRCPFEGPLWRQRLLCAAVSLVAVMAIVKEMDLHLLALRTLYPDFLTESGSIAPGLFKPDGRPLTGTPFKMRVLTNVGIPFGMKAAILFYFGAFFGVFAAGFLYLLPTWVKGVFKLDPAAWAVGCFGASGMLVQIADRLPAWLDHAYGLDKHAADGISAASSLCTCLEEGGEMMIALCALTAILLASRKGNNGTT